MLRFTGITIPRYPDDLCSPRAPAAIPLADVIAMMTGFLLAWRLPVWATVALGLALEAFVGYMIRDNLALNILMLIHPIDAVKVWQTGGT